MIQSDYMHKFEQAKKYQPSEEDIKSLKKNISKLTPLLTYFIDMHNINDPIMLKNTILNLIEMVFEVCSKSQLVDSRLYELYAIEDILKNPKIINEELPKIKDSGNSHKIYTADSSRSKRLVLINANDELSKTEALAEQYNITDTINFDLLLKQYPPKSEERVSILLLKRLLNEKDRNKRIALVLENQKNRCENFITKNLIDSLISMYDFFHAFEFDKSYIFAYNASGKKYGFSDLEYTIDDLRQTFSREYLETLSLRDLCFLNAFWANRFAKESSVIKSTFCAIDSLNIWQEVIDGKTSFEVPEETLVACLQKTNFLTRLLKKTFVIHQKNIYYHELNNPEIPISKEKDYTSYYTRIYETIKDEYEDFFSANNLTNNDFFKNAVFVSIFVNLEMLAYRKKDTSIEPLIKNILDINHFKNWGLVRKELINGKFVDVIDSNRPLVLVSFDVQGFNMPIRFHMSKRALTELSQQSNLDCLIPEYQGHEDFIFYNPKSQKYENVPANIIIPIPKSHRKIIMDYSKDEGTTKNMWEHFYHLVNGKIPEHLTVPTKKGKKTVKARIPRHYTNLLTGQQYIEDGKSFKEVNNNDGR